jgi:excisionase family DNA binding protein
MERMTLREAAERTSRSVTTLRRYIRSGRLRAEKRGGRYGPEYFVSEKDLVDAGLETEPWVGGLPEPVRAAPQETLERVFRESVPLTLYQELHMKHEQLLVQYGMVRAAGLRVLELQGELDTRRRQLEDSLAEIARLKEKPHRELAVLKKKLAQLELELEGRHLEIAALKEKIRGLEMLTRNAVTTETIERQFSEVVEQIQRVDDLEGHRPSGEPLRGPWSPTSRETDRSDH